MWGFVHMDRRCGHVSISQSRHGVHFAFGWVVCHNMLFRRFLCIERIIVFVFVLFMHMRYLWHSMSGLIVCGEFGH